MEGIQRKFRLNQVNKFISILGWNKNITDNKSFEDFTILIQEKRILTLVNLILSKINLVINYGKKKPITSQMFLSAFVIAGYEEDVITRDNGIIVSNQNLNNAMVSIAKEVIEKFNQVCVKSTLNNIRSLHTLLIMYKEIFQTWKSKDLSKLLHNLTTSYYEIESIIILIKEKNTLTEEEEEYITLCKIHQESIIDKIIFLNGQEYFNNYHHEEVSLDADLKKHIKETMYNAYWNILENELNSKPPVYTQLLNILTEICDMFCEFVPNRPDIQQEIKDRIDIDLIKNMVEHSAFDDENLYKLTTYIISLIKKFQPPVMDEEVEEWERGMLHIMSQKFDYTKFLVIFFRSVFNMIQTITTYLKIAAEELDESIQMD